MWFTGTGMSPSLLNPRSGCEKHRLSSYPYNYPYKTYSVKKQVRECL